MTGVIAALVPVIVLIIKALVELFLDRVEKPDEVVNADSDPDLTKRLRDRVRETKGSVSPSR